LRNSFDRAVGTRDGRPALPTGLRRQNSTKLVKASCLDAPNGFRAGRNSVRALAQHVVLSEGPNRARISGDRRARGQPKARSQHHDHCWRHRNRTGSSGVRKLLAEPGKVSLMRIRSSGENRLRRSWVLKPGQIVGAGPAKVVSGRGRRVAALRARRHRSHRRS